MTYPTLPVDEDVPWELDPTPTAAEEKQINDWINAPVAPGKLVIPVGQSIQRTLGSNTRRWHNDPADPRSYPNLEQRWKGGYPQELVDWYNGGADGQIDWGTDGDFEACVAIAGKYIDNPEGFCNERHQDATGAAPGHAPGEKEDKSVPSDFETRGAVTIKGVASRSAEVAKQAAIALFKAYHTREKINLVRELGTLYKEAYIAGVRGAANGKGGAQITDGIKADDSLSPIIDDSEDEDELLARFSADDAPTGLMDLLKGVEDTADNILGYMDTDGAPSIEDQSTAMADTEAAVGAEAGAQDAFAAGGFDQAQSVPDDDACDVCIDKASDPYDLGDDGPPWHKNCGCESEPAGSSDNTQENASSLGRHIRRWVKRDWAEWDAEHPYEAHPREGVTEFPDSHVQPVASLQGASAAYAEQSGIAPSGNVTDFQSIVADPVRGPEIGAAYNALPLDDPAAHASYQAMADETAKQYEYMTGTLGIKVDVQATDPYPSVKEMVNDVQNNHHISVLSTETTGSHPFFSNETNDQFRAVHDVFGHAATGRGFDRNGEEAAWTAHSQMFSPLARQAMTSETRGQNSAMVWGNGEFQPQKVALLPTEYVTRAALVNAELRKSVKEAEAVAAITQAGSDADNLYSVGYSHHASNGRHFPPDYIAPEDRATTVDEMNAIELRIIQHDRSK